MPHDFDGYAAKIDRHGRGRETRVDNTSGSIVQWRKGGDIMAYSEAQKKATLKYRDKAYDRFEIIAPKGTKEIWKAFAAKQGKSLNAYISELVESDISKNTSGEL